MAKVGSLAFENTSIFCEFDLTSNCISIHFKDEKQEGKISTEIDLQNRCSIKRIVLFCLKKEQNIFEFIFVE